jgi:hypothetical protein
MKFAGIEIKFRICLLGMKFDFILLTENYSKGFDLEILCRQSDREKVTWMFL